MFVILVLATQGYFLEAEEDSETAYNLSRG